MYEMMENSKQNNFRPLIIFAGTFFLLLVSLQESQAGRQCGRASWYALDGQRTANGERMNSRRLTAAHRTMRFGTRVKVRNLANGRTVTVRINDRGPFTRGRIIDLSRAAARKLGFLGRGSTRVCLSR